MVAHPQPHEMPPAVGLRIIDKSRTAMAEGPVVDELYLSGLQAEIDREVIVLEKVEHRRDCYLAILVKRLTLERVPAADWWTLKRANASRLSKTGAAKTGCSPGWYSR